MGAHSSALKRRPAATGGEHTGRAPEPRERRSGAPPAAKRRFVSGESLLYLGRQYRLRVVQDPVCRSARLFGRCLHVPGGPGWKPEAVKRHVVSWYRDRCEHHFPDRVHHLADRPGRLAPSLPSRHFQYVKVRGLIRLRT